LLRFSAWHKANEVCRRLSSVPGIGPLTATAIAATVPDPGVFKSGREFAAWLGLTPRQNSSGGKDRLGRITCKGNQHVRRLLIIGAHAALLNSRVLKATDWVQGMMQRRPRQVVAVALAYKMARIAWALMARGTSYMVAAAALRGLPAGSLRERRSMMAKSVAPTDRDSLNHSRGIKPA